MRWKATSAPSSPFWNRRRAHAGEPVTRVDTHSAHVFLAGERAWKLKRAVRYDYLDFSTLERRRAACEAEVRLNRRTAPAIYLGVVPVVRRDDGSLAIGGSGTVVDWLVAMKRFDERNLLDRLAARKALALDVMGPLAAAIAGCHATAERRPDHGGVAGMTWVATGNGQGYDEFGGEILDREACRRLTDQTLREIAGHDRLLESRRVDGWVRQCHGDLHLRNIVLLDGQPTLFDAIEFNDEIACTDVLYDLAFLLMDLWRRQLPGHANVVWNRYLAETQDYEGVRLMPLFLSCRAAVRAKTSATAAGLQTDAAARGDLGRTAREYLAMALALLNHSRPCVAAVGGLSGSGKSTLARAMAADVGAPPGAIVLRSDEIRKRICGMKPFDRLGPDGYTPGMSRAVYEEIAALARTMIRDGQSVIVDAVYARPDDRRAIEEVATAAGAPFLGMWLEAPPAVLLERVVDRAPDASDADASVLHEQLAGDVGEVTWHRLDGARPPDAVLARARTLLSNKLVHTTRTDRPVGTPS